VGMRHLVRSWHCAVRCALSAVASTSGGQPEVYYHEQMAGAQDTESSGQRAKGAGVEEMDLDIDPATGDASSSGSGRI